MKTFWLADKAFAILSILALVSVVYAMTQVHVVEAISSVIAWLLGLIIWAEYRAAMDI